MKILWPHTFNASEIGSGTFMYTSMMSLNKTGIRPDLLYLGNLRQPSTWISARRQIRCAFEQADLLHCQWGSAAGYVSGISARKPKILSLRGSDWTPASSSRIKQRAHAALATRLTRLSIPKYDAIICMSRRMAREVSDLYPTMKIYVIPDPVDTEQFCPMEQTAARALLNLADQGHKYVLFGSLKTHNALKRKELAIGAVEYARRIHPLVSLLPIHGIPHEQVRLYLAACDATICTSVSEGWPNIIKESLACNLPFISTDVSDLKEIAEHDSHCRVADPTAEALGSKLAELLHKRRPDHLSRYIADMTIENHGKQLRDCYLEIISK